VNPGDFLKALKLDTWYMVCVYLGGVILVLSFFIEVKGIANTHLQLISAGIFLIGLGEWKNHKTVSTIKPPNAYTGGAALISYRVRDPDSVGVLMQVGGVIFFAIAAWGMI
jgi:hypothetical protein